jgi:dihydropyrimidinase
MALDSVIRGGQIVTADSTYVADLGITDGKVAVIQTRIEAAADREIDARGLLLLPGAIDVHTHFDTGVGGSATADDYESGSRAAAFGGITTFVNFAFQERGNTFRSAIEREVAKATGHTYIDYGLHLVITDLGTPASLDEVPGLVRDGFTSIKVFTAVGEFQLSDADLLRVLGASAKQHILVNVHAEDGALVDHLSEQLLAQKKRGVENLPAARPPEAEALATARVAGYGSMLGCPIYFVHLSCRKALDAVRAARSDGAEIYVETRPAYLFMDESRYTLPEREGNKFVCWPPLRTEDDQRALWDGLRSGEIQTYATDHTTWMAAQKMDPQHTFAEIPGGVSNVQTSVGMLYAEGVKRGRITINQMVAITATNPAKLFGLWPAKGTLTVGSDADILLIDPEHELTITSGHMQSKSDFDPYEGYAAKGWPVTTISRGEVIVEKGHLSAKAGRGRLLRRQRYHRL